jgi:RNA polymerase sigma factor (sigma-70 family)
LPNPNSDERPTGPYQYRKVIGALALRAARMGSRDPEAAAQEAIRRSLANAASRAAVEYYFHEQPPSDPPEWSLVQLLGWLHGVVRFVVWEERARASTQRETAAAFEDLLDVPDPSPSQLDAVIDIQLREIVHECVMRLSDDRRAALLLRLQGAKYDEIARRLGTNENTVATWLRRAVQDLVHRVRVQMDDRRAAGGRLTRRREDVSCLT